MTKIKNGNKYGTLTVIKRVEDKIDNKGRRFACWQCLCDCQKDAKEKEYIIKTSWYLLNTKNPCCPKCGKNNQKEKMKKFHENNRSSYDLSGDYGVGKTYKGEIFYFDLEDYDKIKNYNWFVNDQGYLLARICENNKISFIRMHRLILNVSDKKIEVDHKKGIESRNDNRKSNLRLATHSQNNINKDLKINNTSGYTGVDFCKATGKWRARIQKNKIVYELGCYDNLEDAVKVRKQAEEDIFGEWSYDNSRKD